MSIKLQWYSEHRWWWLTLLSLWVLTQLVTGLTWLFGPAFVPLWYTIPVLSQQLAHQNWLAVIPMMSTLLVFTTGIFGRKTEYEHAVFLAQTALISACVLHFFLLVALLRISKVAM